MHETMYLLREYKNETSSRLLTFFLWWWLNCSLNLYLGYVDKGKLESID